MIRPSLALLILCFSCALAPGQSFARRDRTADQVVASQAILLLKRLDDDVIVYKSLGQFEEGRQLARVPFETFQRNLNEVSGEIEELASRLPQGRLRSEISNALASYRDGAYWWEKAYQPRVIHVSEFRYRDADATPVDAFFRANIPYTVAIHWRHANKHLQRAIRELG